MALDSKIQIIYKDIDIAEAAFTKFLLKTEPGSLEEKHSISVLRNYPFFRISGKNGLGVKNADEYKGVFHSTLGNFFSTSVFKRFQSIFTASLTDLKKYDNKYISNKLVSLARFKEISNLRLDAISEKMGLHWMDHFLSERNRFLDKSHPRQLTIIMTYECNLKCPFCFSKGLAIKAPGFLDDIMIERILHWMAGKNFKLVSLFGGEPTIHPMFINFIKKINESGYKVYFATNGLFAQNVAQALGDTDTMSITLNVPSDNECTDQQKVIIKKNLRQLPDKIQKIFRITLSKRNGGNNFLKEISEEFDVDTVSIALAFPSPEHDNIFIEQSEFSNLVQDIRDLIAFTNNKGIYCALAKPVPFCAFGTDDLMTLLYGFDFLSPCTINQDHFLYLTTISHTGFFYPCIALPDFKSVDIRDNPSLSDLSDYNESVVESLIKNPVLDKCSECNLFKLGICQGFCYAYYR